jgi:hypothetical protein
MSHSRDLLPIGLDAEGFGFRRGTRGCKSFVDYEAS